MWENSLAIQNPFGVSVFGSSLLKVSPDTALINSSVTRIEQKPSDSFSKAKSDSRTVSEFLRKSKIEEFGTSRISLNREARFMNGESRLVGYKATVGFSIKINALDRLEEIVTGVIEAGANEIASIQFQISDLKGLRAKARAMAIEAAKEKAVIYSKAAGVSLGNVIHIQDVNPQLLQQRLDMMRGHGQPQQELIDQEVNKQTLDPRAVEATAAVLLAFSIEKSDGGLPAA